MNTSGILKADMAKSWEPVGVSKCLRPRRLLNHLKGCLLNDLYKTWTCTRSNQTLKSLLTRWTLLARLKATRSDPRSTRGFLCSADRSWRSASRRWRISLAICFPQNSNSRLSACNLARCGQWSCSKIGQLKTLILPVFMMSKYTRRAWSRQVGLGSGRYQITRWCPRSRSELKLVRPRLSRIELEEEEKRKKDWKLARQKQH